MDLSAEDHGTLFLLRARSPAGEEWVTEHIPDDAMMVGDAIVVEHRYIQDIVVGALSDGLDVELDRSALKLGRRA